MKRRYVPAQERRYKKVTLSFSLSGLLVIIMSTFGVISFISSVQANSFEPTPLVTEKEDSREDKISDAILSKEGQLEVAPPPVSVTNVSVVSRVETFPLEKSWPIRGRLTTLFSGYHPAIDIATSTGTPVHPFASGVVTRAGWWGSFGNAVVIQHAQGWESIYAHLSTIFVSINQEVDLSSVIGGVGSTGYSTGPHLHFQLSKDGRPVNPLANLP